MNLKEIADALRDGQLSFAETVRLFWRVGEEYKNLSYLEKTMQNPAMATEEDRQVVDYKCRTCPEIERPFFEDIRAHIGAPQNPIPIQEDNIDSETRAVLERAGYYVPRPGNPHTELRRAIESNTVESENHPATKFIDMVERFSRS